MHPFFAWSRAWLSMVAVLVVGEGAALAQSTPPPPAVYGPAPVYGPPGYGAPPVYGPPPVYVAPPPAAPSAPWTIDNWDPDQPTPAGYNRNTHINGRLLGTGIGLFTAGWLTSAVVGAVGASGQDNGGERKPKDWTPLYIPVAGPFMGLQTLRPSTAGTGALMLGGVVQAVGVLGIALGIADQRVRLVRVDPNAQMPAGSFVDHSGAKGALQISGAIIAGVGGLSLFASGITAIVAGGAAASLSTDCPNHTCVKGTPGGDAYATVRDSSKATQVLLGIGLPSLGGGLSLLLLGSAVGGRSSVSINPTVGRDLNGISAQGVF